MTGNDWVAAYAHQRPITESEKKQIVSAVRTNFVDPYSVRDAEVSDVVIGTDGAMVACIETNAKNRMGGYTGLSASKIVFYPSGKIESLDSEHSSIEFLCSKERMHYHPFPELEIKS